MFCSKCCYSCFFREASVPPSEFLPDIFLTLASRVTAHKIVFLVSGQANQTSSIGLLDSLLIIIIIIIIIIITIMMMMMIFIQESNIT